MLSHILFSNGNRAVLCEARCPNTNNLALHSLTSQVIGRVLNGLVSVISDVIGFPGLSNTT